MNKTFKSHVEKGEAIAKHVKNTPAKEHADFENHSKTLNELNDAKVEAAE